MLFNGRALNFTFSGTQVRIAEHERLLYGSNAVLIIPAIGLVIVDVSKLCVITYTCL